MIVIIRITLAVLVWQIKASVLNCRELASPRIFGGNFKPTQFNTVTVTPDGGLIAGGYTEDESIFKDKLRSQDFK